MITFRQEEKKTIGILAIGTFLEYLDYYLYFHFATVLNKLFFAEADFRSTALLTSFAYCLSFVFRPIAAVIFGYIGDRWGRITVLNLTFILMGLSCIGIFWLPTYDEIGVAASFLITFFRLLQSVSSMGEVVGGEIYLTEYLQGRKIFIGVAILILMCSLACQVALYGIRFSLAGHIDWRYLFLSGIVIFIVGLHARRNLIESVEYIEAKQEGDLASIKPLFRTYVAYFFAESMQPVTLFISVVGINNLFRTEFGYSETDIVARNLNSTYFHILYVLGAIVMFYKFNPYKIAVVRSLLGITLIMVSPILLYEYCEEKLIIVQSLLSFLCIHDVAVTPLKLTAIPPYNRFSRGVLFFSVTRAFVAILTSFGLVMWMPYLKEYFILVFGLPFAIGFLISVIYLQRLDRQKSNGLLSNYR